MEARTFLKTYFQNNLSINLEINLATARLLSLITIMYYKVERDRYKNLLATRFLVKDETARRFAPHHTANSWVLVSM